MIKLGPHKIFAGDFHTHWYWDKQNPTVLLAGMNQLGLDFVVLQDGWQRARECDRVARSYHTGFRVFPGVELGNAFAHIATWIDATFDADAFWKEYARQGPAVDPRTLFALVQGRTRLTVFAHPCTDYAAAYDGTWAPLIALWRAGLFDAMQIQEDASKSPGEAAYRAAITGGCRVPVLAGFDVHGCAHLARAPAVLFGQKLRPLDFITPCACVTTLVFAEEFSDDALIAAVKAGRTVVFCIDENRFIGPPELVAILEAGDYIQRRRALLARAHGISIRPRNVYVGEQAKLEVHGLGRDRPSRLYVPAGRPFSRARMCARSPVTIRNVPDWFRQPQAYFPLVVQQPRERHVYAVLAEHPVMLDLVARAVGPPSQPCWFMDAWVQNRTAAARSVELALDSPLRFVNPAAALRLAGKATRKLSFEVAGLAEPGFEYPLTVRYASGRFASAQTRLVSFPVCRYLPRGESPWALNPAEAVILRERSQVMELVPGGWAGPDDVSAQVGFRWDEQNLYLYAEVRDARFCQTYSGKESFWGDSLQVALEPELHKRGRGYGTCYEFALARAPSGRGEVFVWNSPQAGNAQVRQLSTDAKLEVLRDEARTLTDYRLTLPWTALAPLRPRRGPRFKVAILVNDNDGDARGRKCMLFYGGNIGELKDTGAAHAVTLL